MDRYILLNKIGEGSFSRVLKARQKSSLTSRRKPNCSSDSSIVSSSFKRWWGNTNEHSTACASTTCTSFESDRLVAIKCLKRKVCRKLASTTKQTDTEHHLLRNCDIDTDDGTDTTTDATTDTHSSSSAEVIALKKLRPHPHVLKLLDTFWHKKRFCIVTELMDMNLLEFLHTYHHTHQQAPDNDNGVCNSGEGGGAANSTSNNNNDSNNNIGGGLQRESNDKGVVGKGTTSGVGGDKPLPECLVRSLMAQALSALAHVHRHGLFHRDLKPENLLIKQIHTNEEHPCAHLCKCNICTNASHEFSYLLKIADFGSCKEVGMRHPFTEYIATRWYRAPECLVTDGRYSLEMDIWSLGCVMFELLTARPLFPGRDEAQQLQCIKRILGPTPIMLNMTTTGNMLSKTYPPPSNQYHQHCDSTSNPLDRLLSHCSSECRDLIRRMLMYIPAQRITAAQALTHPFFNPTTMQPYQLNNPANRIMVHKPACAPPLNSAASLSHQHYEEYSGHYSSVTSLCEEESFTDEREETATSRQHLMQQANACTTHVNAHALLNRSNGRRVVVCRTPSPLAMKSSTNTVLVNKQAATCKRRYDDQCNNAAARVRGGGHQAPGPLLHTTTMLHHNNKTTLINHVMRR